MLEKFQVLTQIQNLWYIARLSKKFNFSTFINFAYNKIKSLETLIPRIWGFSTVSADITTPQHSKIRIVSVAFERHLIFKDCVRKVNFF